MRFIIKMARAYPGRTIIVLVAMLLAGLAEGFGLTTMLPLLSTAIDSQTGAAQLISNTSASNAPAAERIAKETLSFLGIPPTLEILLLVVLGAIVLKSILVLLANKQVGYVEIYTYVVAGRFVSFDFIGKTFFLRRKVLGW